MKIVCNEGIRFSCRQCSACCRFDPGYVFLSLTDLKKLAEYVRITEEAFIDTYCRWVPVGDGTERLSLFERENFDCIFWNSGCTVYEARPFQCSSYPFWSRLLGDEELWDENAKECPGIGAGRLFSAEEIEAILRQRENEPIISRLIDRE